MGAILEAYITNLGKYAEGQLVGETLKFPTTTEEVQALHKLYSQKLTQCQSFVSSLQCG